MHLLDVRTIFIVCTSFVFLYGIGMMAFARKMPSYNGLYLLAIVNFLLAIGISLIFLRDHIDIFWSIIVGNSLILLSANLTYQAHLRFINIEKKSAIPSTAILIFTIVLLFISTYGIPDANTRITLLSLFYFLQFALIAYTVWHFQQQSQQRIYTPLSVIAGGFALFFVFRFVVALFDDHFIATYGLTGSIMQALQVIFLMLYIALLDFFIVLIATDQLVQKIAELAYRDSLTTLYNRRGLDHTMEQDNAFFDKPLAVIMCDIDHFKLINDHYGHHVGDIVIKSFARQLKESTRKTDICTRWGGEEFLIILPLTDEQEALMIAEKIRVACEQLIFPEHPELCFTTSFGICSKKDGHNFDELINDADHALYQAKTQGRNQVCIFNAEQS